MDAPTSTSATFRTQDELKKDFHKIRDELLVKMKKAESTTKCTVCEKDLKKLNEDLAKMKLENKKLQTSNTDLSNELKKLKENRSAIKEELAKRENAITKHKLTIVEPKDEVDQSNSKYLELKQNFTKEDISDDTLRKIIQIYRRITDLERGITAETSNLVKKIGEHDGDEEKKLIATIKSDYDKCEKKLKSKGIIIYRTQFIDVYMKYKLLCQRNDDDRKKLFKHVYEMDKFIKDLRKQCDVFSEDLSKDVEKIEKFKKDFNTSLVKQGFTAEEELCRDVLKIAKEEIAFREKFLQIEGETSRLRDYNILNDGKANNISSPIATDSKKKSKSVILFDAPDGNQSEYEDRLLISTFLEKHKLDDKFFQCRRLRKDNNGKRPLVIEFTNEEIVEKIMVLAGQQSYWFLGFNPSVHIY